MDAVVTVKEDPRERFQLSKLIAFSTCFVVGASRTQVAVLAGRFAEKRCWLHPGVFRYLLHTSFMHDEHIFRTDSSLSAIERLLCIKRYRHEVFCLFPFSVYS